MLRIIMIVIRLTFVVPMWLFVYCKRYRDNEKFDAVTRYGQVKDMVIKINKKARVKVFGYGMENLPKESGYLLAPNHQGFEDPLALAETHVRPVAAIVKQELMSVIYIKDCLITLGCLPIDRSDVRASIKVIKEASRQMKAGFNFIVFPEGTRSRNGNKVIEFKGGSFKIATLAKAPIVPVAIVDAYKVFEINSLKKQHVEVHYLEPLYYEDYKDLQTNEIAEIVQAKVQNKIDEVLRNRSTEL